MNERIRGDISYRTHLFVLVIINGTIPKHATEVAHDVVENTLAGLAALEGYGHTGVLAVYIHHLPQ